MAETATAWPGSDRRFLPICTPACVSRYEFASIWPSNPAGPKPTPAADACRLVAAPRAHPIVRRQANHSRAGVMKTARLDVQISV
jgi:hypothetical protein